MQWCEWIWSRWRICVGSLSRQHTRFHNKSKIIILKHYSKCFINLMNSEKKSRQCGSVLTRPNKPPAHRTKIRAEFIRARVIFQQCVWLLFLECSGDACAAVFKDSRSLRSDPLLTLTSLLIYSDPSLSTSQTATTRREISRSCAVRWTLS